MRFMASRSWGKRQWLGLATAAIALGLSPAAQAMPPSSVIPPHLPNLRISVYQESGNCPRLLGLWAWERKYEGGTEYTVIPDTLTIGGPATFAGASDRGIEYTAPLQSRYASCVGETLEQPERYYHARFQNGQVTFRVDFTALPSGLYSEITHLNVVNARPYVRWAVVD